MTVRELVNELLKAKDVLDQDIRVFDVYSGVYSEIEKIVQEHNGEKEETIVLIG